MYNEVEVTCYVGGVYCYLTHLHRLPVVINRFLTLLPLSYPLFLLLPLLLLLSYNSLTAFSFRLAASLYLIYLL
jgi:hypothetical protein